MKLIVKEGMFDIIPKSGIPYNLTGETFSVLLLSLVFGLGWVAVASIVALIVPVLITGYSLIARRILAKNDK